MAASATRVRRQVPGGDFYFDFTFTADTSYPTGGYDVSLPSFWGLNTVTEIIPICFVGGVASGVAQFSYDRTNKKILFYAANGSQVSGSTDIHSAALKVWVRGS